MNNETSKPVQILSIDAWGNADGGYEWNAWYRVGEMTMETLEGLKTDAEKLQYMVDEGYINGVEGGAIEDDQHNYVIVDKQSGEPLFAIEYGNHY